MSAVTALNESKQKIGLCDITFPKQRRSGVSPF
jgi:hypothetical protein